jgi:tetraacyldisaccharide 4'-kinase
MMPKRLHDIAVASWYADSWLSVLLLPFSWVFACLIAVRRSLYQRDIFTRPPLAVPVIVVGNISVGGTGKTPVVAWLAQQLTQLGYRPGIVSRGYGGSYQGPPLIITADHDPALVGDEPVMLARQTGLPVCVAADRVAAVNAVVTEGVNVVIADDGLQHYRMRRVAELLVIDGERGLGNGRLLPAGPLRESADRLAEVDAVFLNGSNPHIEGTVFSLAGNELTGLVDGSSRELSSFAGTRVWALAGIGNPQRFYSRLEAAGLQLDTVPLEDHGVCVLDDLTSRRQQPILMTEKDAVKYRQSAPDNVWFLPVRAVFDQADTTTLMRMLTAKLS